MRTLGALVFASSTAVLTGCVSSWRPDHNLEPAALAAEVLDERGYNGIDPHAASLKDRLPLPQRHVSWSAAKDTGNGVCAAYRVSLVVAPHQTPPDPPSLMPYVLLTEAVRVFHVPLAKLETPAPEKPDRMFPDCEVIDPAEVVFFEASSPELAELGARIHHRIGKHISDPDDQIHVACGPNACGDSLARFAKEPLTRIRSCEAQAVTCVFFHRPAPRGIEHGVRVTIERDDSLTVEIDTRELIVVTKG